jgi:hypothetical protein
LRGRDRAATEERRRGRLACWLPGRAGVGQWKGAGVPSAAQKQRLPLQRRQAAQRARGEGPVGAAGQRRRAVREVAALAPVLGAVRAAGAGAAGAGAAGTARTAAPSGASKVLGVFILPDFAGRRAPALRRGLQVRQDVFRFFVREVVRGADPVGLHHSLALDLRVGNGVILQTTGDRLNCTQMQLLFSSSLVDSWFQQPASLTSVGLLASTHMDDAPRHKWDSRILCHDQLRCDLRGCEKHHQPRTNSLSSQWGSQPAPNQYRLAHDKADQTYAGPVEGVMDTAEQ